MNRINLGIARRGFTLVELLVVLGVVLALAAIGVPLLAAQRARSDQQRAAVLVQAVASAIEGYGRSSFSWVSGEPPQQRLHSRPLWDLDRDGLLDGDPARSGGDFPPGYSGFVAMAQPGLGAGDVDAAGRVVDPWGRVLRIAHAAGAYGAADVNVWSQGPDPADPSDDIASWQGEP